MGERADENARRIEAACEVMHDAYEAAAVGAGWETQAASRKPWADVPEANKATMRAALAALLDHLGHVSEQAAGPGEILIHAAEHRASCIDEHCCVVEELARETPETPEQSMRIVDANLRAMGSAGLS